MTRSETPNRSFEIWIERISPDRIRFTLFCKIILSLLKKYTRRSCLAFPTASRNDDNEKRSRATSVYRSNFTQSASGLDKASVNFQSLRRILVTSRGRYITTSRTVFLVRPRLALKCAKRGNLRCEFRQLARPSAVREAWVVVFLRVRRKTIEISLQFNLFV